MYPIRIATGSIHIQAELNETHTAGLVWNALPVDGLVNRWGDEIYCHIPVEAELEKDSRDVVEKGEIGYWPMGQAFCIFFGLTPASRSGEIRAYSPVNIIGCVAGDVTVLKHIKDGERIRIEKSEG
jgi:hypothetical protein